MLSTRVLSCKEKSVKNNEAVDGFKDDLALNQLKVKNVNVRRVYMNAHTHGMEPHIHRDDGDLTMIYYPRMSLF